MLTITYGNFVNLTTSTVDENLKYSSTCTVRVTEMNQSFYYKQGTVRFGKFINTVISRAEREKLKNERRGIWVVPNLSLVHYFMPNFKKGESMIYLRIIPDELVAGAIRLFGAEFGTPHESIFVLTQLGLTFDLSRVTLIRALGANEVYDGMGENKYLLIYNDKKYQISYVMKKGNAGLMVTRY